MKKKKKTSDSQVSGLKAYAANKNKETIDKANAVIDRLKKTGKPINFKAVCKEAGISRSTLYSNPQLKERILSLRHLSKVASEDSASNVPKNEVQIKADRVISLRERVRKLEEDKRNLIIQLVDYEELKAENERLKRLVEKA